MLSVQLLDMCGVSYVPTDLCSCALCTVKYNNPDCTKSDRILTGHFKLWTRISLLETEESRASSTANVHKALELMAV